MEVPIGYFASDAQLSLFNKPRLRVQSVTPALNDDSARVEQVTNLFLTLNAHCSRIIANTAHR